MSAHDSSAFDDKSPEALAALLGQNPAALTQHNNTDPALPEYDLASYNPNTAVPRNEDEKPVTVNADDRSANSLDLERPPPEYNESGGLGFHQHHENTSHLSVGSTQIPAGGSMYSGDTTSSSSPTLNTGSTSNIPNLPAMRAVGKFYISQRGNSLKPWPFSHPNELVTLVLDGERTRMAYTSTRFKKSSGTCVLRRGGVEPVAELPDVTNPCSAGRRGKENGSGTLVQPTISPKEVGVTSSDADDLEVTTTYFFGPGNDPIISFLNSHGEEVQVGVHAIGKTTRGRWFEYLGARYEWRYKGKYDGAGLLLEKLVTINPNDQHHHHDESSGSLPKTAFTAELEGSHAAPGQGEGAPAISTLAAAAAPAAIAPTSPTASEEVKHSIWKGKGKATKKKDECSKPAVVRVPVADFVRDAETAKSTLGFTPAGHGGWVTVYDQGEGTGAAEGLLGKVMPAVVVLPEWLVVATCLVMLKRERDRRTMHIGIAMSGGGGF
ncbi:hypothetical protein DFH27DRAFT_48073 [Peziza echinospora]|nr:hypothetical protein DFH27DRAFT_48073 [Peziza echinospora]